MGIFLPVKIAASKKCTRCKMQYEASLDECPHCKDLNDGRELAEHIEKHQNQLEANSKLGVVFFGVACLLGAGMILIYLL